MNNEQQNEDLKEHLGRLQAESTNEFVLTVPFVLLLILNIALFILAALTGFLSFPPPVSSVTGQCWIAVLVLLTGLSGNLLYLSLSIVAFMRKFLRAAEHRRNWKRLNTLAAACFIAGLLTFWLVSVFDNWILEHSVDIYRLIEARLFPYEEFATIIFGFVNIALVFGVALLGIRLSTATLLSTAKSITSLTEKS